MVTKEQPSCVTQMGQKVSSCLPDEKLGLITRHLAITAGWQGRKGFHGDREAGRCRLTDYQVQV